MGGGPSNERRREVAVLGAPVPKCPARKEWSDFSEL
jgi:hypothetical protein